MSDEDTKPKGIVEHGQTCEQRLSRVCVHVPLVEGVDKPRPGTKIDSSKVHVSMGCVFGRAPGCCR
eukprot:1332057-Amphidinium_carterae.1